MSCLKKCSDSLLSRIQSCFISIYWLINFYLLHQYYQDFLFCSIILEREAFGLKMGDYLSINKFLRIIWFTKVNPFSRNHLLIWIWWKFIDFCLLIEFKLKKSLKFHWKFANFCVHFYHHYLFPFYNNIF